MLRRVLVYAVLLLAAFLVGRWSISTPPEPVRWVTEVLQPVGAGLADSTEVEQSVLPPGVEARSVTRVVDGDTVVLDGGERVRLIGVDTPETVHPTKPVEYFGKEASAFTKRMAEGQKVYLEYEQGSSTKDRYGRTLGYVYLKDGTLLNKEIVERGYGHAYTRFPFSKMEEFRGAEREAKAAGRGLWGGEEPEESTVPPQQERRQATPSPPSQSLAQGKCIPRSQCCKVCSKGRACGNSCISTSYTCRKGRGCACNGFELCQ